MQFTHPLFSAIMAGDVAPSADRRPRRPLPSATGLSLNPLFQAQAGIIAPENRQEASRQSPLLDAIGTGLDAAQFPPVPRPKPDMLQSARREAERRFPFVKRFRDVEIVRAESGVNKGGMGEFQSAFDSPTGKPRITVGENSSALPGGIADTIVADMVHAAAGVDPEFQALKDELINSLSDAETQFAKRRFEQDFKGKFSGSNFETFDNFLRAFWADGIVQHLLLPSGGGIGKSEIDEIRRDNPKAGPVLDRILDLFHSE